ncbi:MAG: response regulator transcription factor [Deferrisomatales bacterium]
MSTPGRRVVLVEGQPLLRDAVRGVLAEGGYRVLASVGRHQEGLAAVERAAPDVVVAGLSVAPVGGCALLGAVKAWRPDLPLAVFSTHLDRFHVKAAFCAGASAYIAETEVAGSLADALREILDGRLFLSPRLVPVLARDWLDSRAGSGGLPVLNPREREVFRLFGRGCSVQEIAARLNRSPRTVETYCARLGKKLGVTGPGDLHRHAVAAVSGGGGPAAPGEG